MTPDTRFDDVLPAGLARPSPRHQADLKVRGYIFPTVRCIFLNVRGYIS